MNDEDVINSPLHYKTGEIECIDAMIQQFGRDYVNAYCEVNAFKYLWRCHHKQQHDEDVQKAIWYLRFSIGDDPRDD